MSRDAEWHVRRSPPRESARRDKKRQLGLDDKPLAIFLGSFLSAERGSGGLHLHGAGARVAGGQLRDLRRRRDRGRSGLTRQARDRQRARHRRRRRRGPARLPRRGGCRGQSDVLRVGTNIKMFDFMAAGLPVVSTPTGARGITLFESALHICARARIRRGATNGARRRRVCASPRHGSLADWRARAIPGSACLPRLGRLLTRHRTPHAARRSASSFHLRTPAPSPTLLDCLARRRAATSK